MNWRITPGNIEGSVSVPGDKSIAHRAVMISSLARSPSLLRNLPRGEDVLSTIGCMRALGARICAENGGETVRIEPPPRLVPPETALNAGNSGTTARLLAGILSGQCFTSEIQGDASLSRRPMRRIIDPLEKMGAQIESQDGGKLPLRIKGGELRGIDYEVPVASAQVKSAILLAGLFASDSTTILEPLQTRDHTERMLLTARVRVESAGSAIRLEPSRPHGLDITMPGDFSSAAFFLAAAAVQGTEVVTDGVGINETRIGLLRVLERMGVSIEITHERESANEPIGRVRVAGKVEHPIVLDAADIPNLVDELPILVLLATQASGTSVIRGARELRVKETDRIAAVTNALRLMGAEVEELKDGFVVRGPTKLRGNVVQTRGDHRLAMMLAVAGTIAEGHTVIEGAEASVISYPGFADGLRVVGGRIDVA